MKGDYWTSTLVARVSRRRALAMTGSAAAGAAFLAACGSGSSKETTPASSLVIAPSDTSKQAKRGGVAKMNLTSDPASWEPTQGPGLWFNIVFALAFQQIVKLKEGIAQAPGGDVLGDVVESYEFSPTSCPSPSRSDKARPSTTSLRSPAALSTRRTSFTAGTGL
jgi:hypothetical protein